MMSRPRGLRERESSLRTGMTMPAEIIATATPRKKGWPKATKSSGVTVKERSETSRYQKVLPLLRTARRSSSMPAMNIR